jgi:hypothetical protein
VTSTRLADLGRSRPSIRCHVRVAIKNARLRATASLRFPAPLADRPGLLSGRSPSCGSPLSQGTLQRESFAAGDARLLLQSARSRRDTAQVTRVLLVLGDAVTCPLTDGLVVVSRGVKNTGSSYATSGVWHGSANAGLSARCRIAIAQKVFPAALRCAVHAPRKPWVIVLANPSNACVRPKDGFTPSREMTTDPSAIKQETVSPFTR